MEFREVLQIEIRNGLIIVPVNINGEVFRFLFDSGAPLSISKELQEKFKFKRVSQGNIKDSDQNRLKVDYVQIDSLLLGSIPFTMQTAFVADFQANEVLRCFELDGILGSNLMRYCNWLIDYESGEIVLTSNFQEADTINSMTLPFYEDQQYDMHISFNIGKVDIRNAKVDYGSAGSLLLPAERFQEIQELGIVPETFEKLGRKSSGLIGGIVEIDQSVGYTDSMLIQDLRLDDVQIRSGHKGLVGFGVLSRFVVGIDWENHLLHLRHNNKHPKNFTYGFGLWPAEDGPHLVIQQITTGSVAQKAGLEVGMKVMSIEELDFAGDSKFCDYVDMISSSSEELQITVVDTAGQERVIILKNARLGGL